MTEIVLEHTGWRTIEYTNEQGECNLVQAFKLQIWGIL